MALIACWFAQHRAGEGPDSPESPSSSLSSGSNSAPSSMIKPLLEALQRLPSSFHSVLRPATHSVIRDIAQDLAKVDQVVIFGSGWSTPVAQEGVMKFKELAQIHARSWCSVEEDVPHVLMHRGSNRSTGFVFVLVDPQPSSHLALAKSLYDAGYPVTILTNKFRNVVKEGVHCHHSIMLPENGPLTALVAIAPLQVRSVTISFVSNNNHHNSLLTRH